MPFLGAILGGAASSLAGGLFGSSGGPGGSNVYSPQGLNNADTGWQNMFNSQQNNAVNAQGATSPLFGQTLAAQTGYTFQPNPTMTQGGSPMMNPVSVPSGQGGQPQAQQQYQAPTSGWGSNSDGGMGQQFSAQQAAQQQAAQQGGAQGMPQQNGGSWQKTGQGINYDPLQQASNTAGQQYQGVANLAGQQAGIYGQLAGLAGGQQQSMYDAGNRVMNTAMDPQQALFHRTQQQLSDQVNAGQAQRGLGASAVGGSEYNQTMSNFDIDWQNQQLARQAQGIQAGAQASNAGGVQGQLMGANLAGQMGAAQSQPGFTQQAAQTPLTSQQYIAGQPAAAANQYLSNMSNQNQMLGNVAGQAIPYMYQGAGTQQAQQMFNGQQNAAMSQGVGNLVNQGVQSYNTPGSWLSNMFNGQGQASGGSALSGGDQSNIWAANGYGGGV